MKPMLAGFAAAVIIATAAWFILGYAGFSSQEVYSSANVRID